MTIDVSDLSSIFRMITPSDILGAQKLAVGSKIDNNLIRDLLEALYGSGAGGVLSLEDLASKLSEFSKRASDPQAASDFKKLIRFYSSSGKKVDGLGESQYMAKDRNGSDVINSVTFDEIVGKTPNKNMGIILSNSGFLSPLVRNAEKVEMFMNFIPSIVASRMVPYLDVEFSFNKPSLAGNDKAQASGLMKFLLGGENARADDDSPTAKLIRSRAIINPETNTENSTAGMEMFTSPQTLVNATPITPGSRYVDVIDPMRPFMSIESFNVNVTSTVGLMSYRKGTLTLKLHDRSRLAEISDLVRPQIYQNSATAPTVWITYGWRHPYEPGNPYSDFINGNMLIREAYGIVNSQFSFDQTGQVTVTVELWTKGLTELRTIRMSDSHDDALPVLRKIESLAKQIAAYNRALNIGPAEGVNREIRGYTILESAERGTFPDMSTKEILDAVAGLEKSLSTPGSKLNKPAADALKNALSQYYASSDKKNLNFKEQIKTQASTAAAKKFEEVLVGPDPFIPFDKKDEKASQEGNKAVISHPLSKIFESKNKEISTDLSEKLADSNTQFKGYKKKVVSFGKLFSVFVCQAAMLIDGIDEMQVFFYQFNDQAGLAASTNIAEFPIDMPVLLDQYREHIERKGSERLSIEEFVKLVIDAQINDTRSLGYGFRSFFAPYDPANTQDAKLKDGQEQQYENALSGITAQRGPFKKPSIEMYVETTYVSKVGSTTDLLRQFEQKTADPGSGSADYTRVMRIHIFDRTNNPYRLAGTILRGDSESGAAFVEVDSDYIRNNTSSTKSQVDVWKDVWKGSVTSDAKIELKNGFSNQDIKHMVSKMVPSIIFGSNATMITTANIASKQDPLLSVVQTQGVAQRTGKQAVGQPNGSGVGGLPLRVIPASMTMNSMGCPLLNFGQLFFVDFNTGTTTDNIYGLTGITHTISPGKFDSQMTLTYYDAYGKYEGAPTFKDYISRLEIPEPKK